MLASARASSPRAWATAASRGAGSIRNRTSPAFTSAPSSNSRSSTMPGTRARTSAVRAGSIRPGRSSVSMCAAGSITCTLALGSGWLWSAEAGSCRSQPETSKASSMSGTRGGEKCQRVSIGRSLRMEYEDKIGSANGLEAGNSTRGPPHNRPRICLGVTALRPVRGERAKPSVSPAQLAEHKAQQPRRPDQQELQVLEERRLLAFDMVPDELADPGQHENDHRGPEDLRQEAENPQHEQALHQHHRRQLPGQQRVEHQRQSNRDHGHRRVQCPQDPQHAKGNQRHTDPVRQLVQRILVALTVFLKPLFDRLHQQLPSPVIVIVLGSLKAMRRARKALAAIRLPYRYPPADGKLSA